ncbi:MAG TPA: POTRA domain-containing protein, partial [Prolixibacteraceae bacterium]|nr:POTRA domain-containing protein [Prolixibacteraceae bacterium]
MKKLFRLLKSIRGIFPVTFFLLAASCTSLKYVPDNEYLLNDVKIKSDQKDLEKDKLYLFVRQRENTRILGFFKFHLWLYNLSRPDSKENWLKRTGEPPQIYNQVLADQSTEQLLTYLHNKGYYHARVEVNSHLNERSRKIDLKYSIRTGEQFRIDKVTHLIEDSVIRNLYDREYIPKHFRTGAPLDMELLDIERDSIIRFMKNKGFYHFSKPMLFIEADTVNKIRKGDLTLFIRLPEANRKDSNRIYSPYNIEHFYFNILKSGTTSSSFDTINF